MKNQRAECMKLISNRGFQAGYANMLVGKPFCRDHMDGAIADANKLADHYNLRAITPKEGRAVYMSRYNKYKAGGK